MTTAEARQLVQKTFQNPFDKGQFIYFIKNLVNEIDESKAFHARGYVHEKYRDRIKTYERIGTYTDPEENKIDVLIVYLQKESSIDRARTTLRNFVGDYLKERGEKEAGLIAFVSPNQKDWRFSLVKMEYKITETPSGRIKAKEEFTPAKRYSFLVGVEETSHTAQSRLVPILEDDASNPTLKSIEEAFNIEKVTKEFFEKYRELYLRVKETLDDVLKKDKAIKADFAGKNIDTVDFGKKLLGQIVFLYFLQKKGWFGVKRGEAWGSGSKNFLRELFDKKHGDYKNFFNDILESLFYEALRNDRSHDDHYFSMFKCKIPFLNGGLFDPINNYDWKETDIILSNDLFSNSYKTKEGDIGTGILDIFDRYNFTVKEDEPLEKEVAVDPEMLGKVFENLLEVKDRKSKGTYYTPREIVHYMCQESLVNYLATELDKKVSKKDIETLIKYGEGAIEHDATSVKKKTKDPKYKSSYYKPKLPKSIEKHAKLIDEKLETIRICDPAVGSGAFLVGMMNEIVRTRNVLTPFLTIDENEFERTIYDLKRHAIQNCLYGVDIDPGAVEIAKLRLWLSLVVEEDEIQRIKPLPNLGYRIMQGNSLIETYQDIDFYSEYGEKTLFGLDVQDLRWQQLERKKREYFSETASKRKQEIKQEIDSLLRGFVISAVFKREKAIGKKPFKEKYGLEATSLLQKIGDPESIKPFFLWKLYFSEVFHEKKGFDVMIANPPYDVYEGHRRGEIEEIRRYPIYEKATGGKLNAYKLFLAKSAELQKPEGVLCEIFQNSFLADSSASKIRKHFLEMQRIFKIDSFPERDNIYLRVFENVKMSVCILISQNKTIKEYQFLLRIYKDKYMNLARQITLSNLDVISMDPSNATIPSIDQKELEFLRKISKTTRLKNLARCYEGEINLTFHKKFLKKERNGYAPMIKGAAVQKWFLKEKMSQGEVEYLDQAKYFKENAGNKSQHYKLKRIVLQGITGVDEKYRLKMTIIDPGIFCGNSVNYILINDKAISDAYLLALLNSKLLNWFFKAFSTNSNVNGYEVDNLPIPKISSIEQKPYIERVGKIFVITKGDDYLVNSEKQAKVHDYEKQIDQLVYKLYGLTPEEIKIVEQQEK